MHNMTTLVVIKQEEIWTTNNLKAIEDGAQVHPYYHFSSFECLGSLAIYSGSLEFEVAKGSLT